MEYSVVESESLSELVKEVRKKISEGWIVQGGVSVETFPVDQDIEEEDYNHIEPESHEENHYEGQEGEEESSQPVYLNADLAVPVDWQLTGDSDNSIFENQDEDEVEYVLEDDNAEYSEEGEESEYSEEDQEYDEYDDDDEYDHDGEDDLEDVVYIKRYVQAIVRESKWNRKFSLNTAASAGRFSKFARIAEEKMRAEKMQSSSMRRQDTSAIHYYDDYEDDFVETPRRRQSRPSSTLSTRTSSERGRRPQRKVGKGEVSQRVQSRGQSPSKGKTSSVAKSPVNPAGRWKGQGGYADYNPYESDMADAHRPKQSPLTSAVTQSSENTMVSKKNEGGLDIGYLPLSEGRKGLHGDARLLGKGRRPDKRIHRQQANPRKR